MASLAQSQANYCARIGHMVHSDRYAFQGGENLCGGRGKFSPRTTVNSWLRSKAGHREYLLSPEVKKAGVGTARQNGKMFVAWAFSSSRCTHPDCPACESKPIRIPDSLRIFMRGLSMRINPLKVGVSLVLGLAGLLGMALGAHGVYVYFSRVGLFFGGEGTKLFLMLDVPIRIQDLVLWASYKGLQSWFIPMVIFVVGLAVFSYSRLWDIIERVLNKVRP